MLSSIIAPVSNLLARQQDPNTWAQPKGHSANLARFAWTERVWLLSAEGADVNPLLEQHVRIRAVVFFLALYRK